MVVVQRFEQGRDRLWGAILAAFVNYRDRLLGGGGVTVTLQQWRVGILDGIEIE
jgi:hypothetical protein